MVRRPTRPTRTDTLFPVRALVRSRSARQPDERQELLQPTELPAAKPGAVTPPEGHPKGKATSHSPVVAAAKSRVHPLVMERLDVSPASQLPREDLTRQTGELVRRILLAGQNGIWSGTESGGQDV